MSNVESILALGGMIILAIISLRFNSSILQTSTADFENKVYLTSFSIADNLIEEIKSKSFDQKTVKFPTTNPASLTPPDSLGPDPGEVKPYYNDVDDFNGYLDTTAAPYFEKYYISCKVEYVTSSNPDVASPTQTFYKKVTVTIKSDYLSSPVSISSIYTLK